MKKEERTVITGSADRANSFDFDIHGFVGVRLLNPSKEDFAAVTRQLGPINVPALNREPDITIRFVRHLSLTNLHYVGLNNAGYTENDFFLLQSQKVPAKVVIPFEAIGGRCEIVCETGLRRVPLLTAIINMTLLRKECIPLHASAFVYNGVGILVTGWSKGGKTEALLAFGNQGARYVGDEWIILTKNGKKMYGLPEPVTVWDWQIRQLPKVRSKVKLSDQVLFKTIHGLDNLRACLRNGKFRKSFPARVLNEATPALKRQLHVNMPVNTLFKEKSFELEGKPQRVFLVESHNHPEIAVEPWESADIARRMLFSLQYEQMPLLEHYQAFKFAFPHRENSFLETIRNLQANLLNCALKGKESYRVLHPYPVSLDVLFKKMEPFCKEGVLDVPNRVAV